MNHYAIVVRSIHFQPGLRLENDAWTFCDRAECREVSEPVADKGAASKFAERDRQDEDKQRGHVFRSQETRRALLRSCLVVFRERYRRAHQYRAIMFSAWRIAFSVKATQRFIA